MRGGRSPKVQKILALRGRAAALRASYEAALERIEPGRHRAARMLQEARALKGTLSDCELAELRRAWSGV
jgi:hypothetical protein